MWFVAICIYLLPPGTGSTAMPQPPQQDNFLFVSKPFALEDRHGQTKISQKAFTNQYQSIHSRQFQQSTTILQNMLTIAVTYVDIC